MEEKFYVYAWYIKSTNKVFHVGKGMGRRCYETHYSRNKYFKNIINKYSDDVDVIILINNLSETDAFEIEKIMINYYKSIGQAKTNFHVGGRGGYTGNYDDPERSRKLSEAAKGKIGNKNGMYGRTHTEEARKKISEANIGKKLSPEHIQKLKEANTGRKKSSEEIEKVRQANIGKNVSQETRIKMSLGLSKYKYEIKLGDKITTDVIGRGELYKFCNDKFHISRSIVDRIMNKKWHPTFNKHMWLKELQIDKIERCID